MDRRYTTSEAGSILVGLHQDAVRRLIQDRKLRAHAQVVRGKDKRPRQYIKASELRRYIDSLAVIEVEQPNHAKTKRVAASVQLPD